VLYRAKHEAQRGVVAPLQGISNLRRAHYSTETLDSALVEKVMGWCKVDLEDVTNVPQGLFDYAIVLHGSHNAALPAIGPPRRSRTDCSSTRLRQWGRGSAVLGERTQPGAEPGGGMMEQPS
jgi:hypothetical protein